MEVRIKVPESLKDITVGQYQEWSKVISSNEWTPIRQKVITVAIFCSEDIDTIESISIKSLNDIYEEISNLLNDAFNHELVKIITIEGQKYGFHPDLDSMTTGEWADLEEELREEGDLWKAIPSILAILYRPIVKGKWWKFWKKGYEIEPYDVHHIENIDKMKQVDMATASGMALFFWNLGLASIETFIQSTDQNIRKEMTAT